MRRLPGGAGSPPGSAATENRGYFRHVPEELIGAEKVRSSEDSVAKLGKRRLTRNNRIGAKDLLNRCCALVAVLESMLPARAPKIVLQQNRCLSGRGADTLRRPGLTQMYGPAVRCKRSSSIWL